MFLLKIIFENKLMSFMKFQTLHPLSLHLKNFATCVDKYFNLPAENDTVKV
jgi:hypothetical protein